MDSPEIKPENTPENKNQDQLKPAPTPPPVAPQESKEKFDLFQKEKKDPTLDGPAIADNILKLTEDKKPEKSLLGDIPTFDEDIIDQSYVQKRRLSILYITTTAIAALFALSFGFFYTQLSSNFTLLGANITQQLQTSTEEIYSIQTDINENTYLTTQILLNSFAFDGNRYQDLANRIASQKLSSDEKNQAEQEMLALQPKLINTLKELQQVVKRPATAPIYDATLHTFLNQEFEFEQRARQKLNQSVQKLADKPDQKDQYNLYKDAIRLIGNQDLVTAITQVDTNQLAASSAQLSKVVDKITDEAKNEFSIVNSLKSRRVQWNEILVNIIKATKQAEEGLLVANESAYQMQLYNSGHKSILYSSYNIDAATGRVTVSGTLKTPDEKTFSTIANLIESFESSPNFRDIDYRSFSKSGSSDQGYESNFRLEFFLENNL